MREKGVEGEGVEREESVDPVCVCLLCASHKNGIFFRPSTTSELCECFASREKRNCGNSVSTFGAVLRHARRNERQGRQAKIDCY